MADVTWRPEVVEAVAREMSRRHALGPAADREGAAQVFESMSGGSVTAYVDRHWHEHVADASAALSASPLPDALDLIQRMLDGRRGARADARAFLARVRGA